MWLTDWKTPSLSLCVYSNGGEPPVPCGSDQKCTNLEIGKECWPSFGIYSMNTTS